MPNTSDPTDDLRAFFRDERRDEDHPEGERLVAYHERRLPPEEQEEMRQHLAACPDCAAQLLELAALLESEVPSGPAMLPPELEAAWERQRAGRPTPSPAAAPSSAPLQGNAARAGSYRPSSRWAWRLAASLALTTAALAALAVYQRQTISELAKPLANPPLVQLLADASRRSSEQKTEVLAFRPGEEGAWIILNPRVELGYPSYRVDFVSENGEVRWSFEDLAEDEVGFRFQIRRSQLPAGDYTVELWAMAAGEWRKIEQFALQVKAS